MFLRDLPFVPCRQTARLDAGQYIGSILVKPLFAVQFQSVVGGIDVGSLEKLDVPGIFKCVRRTRPTRLSEVACAQQA